VRLQNTVHPLTRAGQDLGTVSDSLPTGRLVLLLNRPAEQETALQTFLNDVHRRGSANYHQWVTPKEYGDRFGAGDSDMQTASTWLRSQGFNVSGVTKSRQFIEFSGTAAQVRQAFHTAIHRYSVQGETHYANANDLSIPAALAPLVRGISPPNDFRAQPLIKLAGQARYSAASHKTTPEWTVPNPFGSANANAYSVAPEDFATQYDLAPLYQAGVDGTGQTIGIINESTSMSAWSTPIGNCSALLPIPSK
jgi:subtilase family serine protease